MKPLKLQFTSCLCLANASRPHFYDLASTPFQLDSFFVFKVQKFLRKYYVGQIFRFIYLPMDGKEPSWPDRTNGTKNHGTTYLRICLNTYSSYRFCFSLDISTAFSLIDNLAHGYIFFHLI
jgi:hypothetical protein